MADTGNNAPWSAPDLKQATGVVLDTFRSARPQDAFEAAVRVYRQHNPSVPTTLARRAVAKIICGGVTKQP